MLARPSQLQWVFAAAQRRAGAGCSFRMADPRIIFIVSPLTCGTGTPIYVLSGLECLDPALFDIVKRVLAVGRKPDGDSTMTQFAIQAQDRTFTFDTDNIPDEAREYIINGLVEYALVVIAQRATAGMGDKPESFRRDAILDKLSRLQNGTYRFGTGAREADPVVIELRAMADEAARQAGWTLTKSREFVRDHGPLAGLVAAALLAAGKTTSSRIDMTLVKAGVEKNKDALVRKAAAAVAARQVNELVLD